MTIEHVIDWAIRLTQIAVVPLLGRGLSWLGDIKRQVTEINERLIKQEAWREAHDKQDDERNDRHEAALEELFARVPASERSRPSNGRARG